MKKNLLMGALIAALPLWSSCNNKKSTAREAAATETASTLQAPDFQADSAYHHIQKQCDFGPRVPNTEAHRQCGDYIAARFSDYGCTITNQNTELRAYDGKILKARNIIASVNPEALKRILICGHWDTRPWCDNDPDSTKWKQPVLGANDGASGIAVMMEMARLMQQHPVSIGVDFVCFDAEDGGAPQWAETDDSDNSDTWCLGSQYWSAHPHKAGYQAKYGILLDMVGGQGCTFSQEGYSKAYAQNVIDKVWSTAQSLGYGSYFLNRTSGYITDDHVPVNQIAHIPCIDIVPYFTDGPSSFGPTWHTTQDDVAHIDKNVLKAVGQTVIQVIYNEDKMQ